MSPSQNWSPRPSRVARSKTMSVSGRACPGGGTTAGRSWTSDCASRLISKPIFSASRSKDDATGSTTSASCGGRVHEQVGMGVEVQRRERPPAPHRIGEGQQDIGAEPDQAADGVGRAVQDRAIEILGGDAVPPRRTERALRDAERWGHLLRGGQVLPGDGSGGDRREQHIAAGGVERAGQRIEQRHRARGLGGVGVMLVAAPGVVGDRARVPEEARGLLELRGGNPAGRLHHLRRIAAAQRGIELEDRVAGHRSARGGEAVLALQREVLAGVRS